MTKILYLLFCIVTDIAIIFLICKKNKNRTDEKED